jgi:REP element-mobilizing transposase RayT
MKHRPDVNHGNLNIDLPDRQSMRLKWYDYRKEGAYFITICARDHNCIFGEITNGEITLRDLGRIAKNCWEEIPDHFENVVLDEFVIMPNHIHGIIVINSKIKSDNINNAKCRGVKFNAPTKNNKSQYYSDISPKPGSISVIIRTFKSTITRWCKKNGFRNFRWQRNFYDRIIRNEKELSHIRQYIINNPLNWQVDKNHPINFNINEM